MNESKINLGREFVMIKLTMPECDRVACWIMEMQQDITRTGCPSADYDTTRSSCAKFCGKILPAFGKIFNERVGIHPCSFYDAEFLFDVAMSLLEYNNYEIKNLYLEDEEDD